MPIKLIETLVAILVIVVLRFIAVKILLKIQSNYGYSKFRTKPIIKAINIAAVILLSIILFSIWGLNQSQVWSFLTSVLAVIGIALFAQWSLLSNITSAIVLFISHPLKIGEKIQVLDKDFNVTGTVNDIGLFFVKIKSEDNTITSIPNNVVLQKMIKTNA